MNKVALVTGSQRGIERATIIEFASRGYDVVIDYIEEEERALELKKHVESEYGVKALTIKSDVREETDIDEMVQEIMANFGRIDVLVNSAGIAIDKEFEDRTITDFRDTINTNLIGPYIVAKRVGEEMMKVKSGKIVNISSTNGINAFFPTSLDYDASKAGLINLTHNFASMYAPNIRVNCIAPGWINTEMNKELDKEYIKEECEHILLERFAEPKEIANVVFFLASDEASYITDTIIRVDGGLK